MINFEIVNNNLPYIYLDAIGKIIYAANDNSIDFVYAISPGLDVVFTSAADILFLKDKLKQVEYVIITLADYFLYIFFYSNLTGISSNPC